MMAEQSTESCKMKEYELARRHLPVLYGDSQEPFLPLYIGYTVFEGAQKSASAKRWIDPASCRAAVCIEYAFYYDYDIQHLYDLEHIWVYLDERERVCGCESSFHGMYLNAMLPGTDILRGENRVHLYVQPGKHAFMPDPALFHLFIDFWSSCAQKAGKDGILTPDVVPEMPQHSAEEDRRMEAFIKERFCFVPSERYERWELSAQLMTWKELCRIIPGRLAACMEAL